MPLVDGKLVTPEAALAKGLCPECGDNFKDSNAVAHFNIHWKTEPPNDKRGDKCRARRLMLTKYIGDHNVRTSNQAAPVAAKPADLP
jgi:hypothetical protein